MVWETPPQPYNQRQLRMAKKSSTTNANMSLMQGPKKSKQLDNVQQIHKNYEFSANQQDKLSVDMKQFEFNQKFDKVKNFSNYFTASNFSRVWDRYVKRKKRNASTLIKSLFCANLIQRKQKIIEAGRKSIMVNMFQ